MNVAEFFRRWGQGIKDLSPAGQLHAKMVGHIGAAAGMLLAIVVMLSRGAWYLTVFLAAFGYLQVVEFIGTRQQWEAARKFEEHIQSKMEGVRKDV